MRGKPKERTFSSKSVTVKFTLLFNDAKSCLARSRWLANSFQGSLFPPSLRAKDPGNEVPDAEDCSPWLLFLG